MDENSCEGETLKSNENVSDDPKEKEPEKSLELEDIGFRIGFEHKPSQNQVTNRCGSSYDASVSGPSTDFSSLLRRKNEKQLQSGLVDPEAEMKNTNSETAKIQPDLSGELKEGNLKITESRGELKETSAMGTEEPVLTGELEVNTVLSETAVPKGEFKKTNTTEAEETAAMSSGETKEPSQTVLQSEEPSSSVAAHNFEELKATTAESGQELEGPSAPTEETDNVQASPCILPSYEERREFQPRVRLAPCVEEQLMTRRTSVGPPPSYSFVMKQKKKMKPMSSPEPLVTVRPPPPAYPGTRGVYITSDESRLERICNFPSFAEPIWRSHSQPALCHQCGIIVLTTTHSHDSVATHVAALALCLFGCWPCCLLPYCMNVCKNTYHHCPICQAFLGLYTPW